MPKEKAGAKTVQEYVKNFAEVSWVKVNPVCRSLTLIVHQPQQRGAVFKKIQQVFGNIPALQQSSDILASA